MSRLPPRLAISCPRGAAPGTTREASRPATTGQYGQAFLIDVHLVHATEDSHTFVLALRLAEYDCPLPFATP